MQIPEQELKEIQSQMDHGWQAMFAEEQGATPVSVSVWIRTGKIPTVRYYALKSFLTRQINIAKKSATQRKKSKK